MEHHPFLGARRYAVRAALTAAAALLASLLPATVASADHLHASISGHVVLPAGAGSVDRAVVVREVGTGRPVGRTYVRRDGSYTVAGLAAGSYRVSFARLSGQAVSAAQFYDRTAEHAGVGSAREVVLGSTTAATGVDATLSTGGSITGTLRDQHGDGLSGCLVQAWTADRSLVTRTARTELAGAFSVGGLTTGDYRLRVVGGKGHCRAGTQHFDGDESLTRGPAPTATVTAALGQSRARDLQYAAGASITGSLTLPAAGRRPLVAVRDRATGELVGGARVAGDGTYTVRGLDPGSYRMAFNRLSGYSTAAPQFYDGVAEGAGAGGAHPVTITGDEAVEAAPATLPTGGTITGRIVLDSDDPSECEVQAVDPRTSTRRHPGHTGRQHLVTRLGFVDPDGTFAVPGLSTGDYLLRVGGWGCSLGTQYYAGSSARVMRTGVQHAVPVSVVLGGTRDVGAVRVEEPVTPVVRPVLSGTPKVGERVTLSAGTWNVTDPILSYQWYDSEGEPVTGATGRDFVPRPQDVHGTLYVMVRARKDGHVPRVLWIESEPVAPADVVPVVPQITATGPPTVQGSGRVGTTLSMTSTGLWSLPPADLAVQWLVDGQPISGATTTSYTAAPGDLGRRLSVRVTASRPGSGRATSDSAAVQVTPGVLEGLRGVTIDGKPKVGKKLRADPTGSPVGAALSYQWLRDGKPIARATRSAYVVGAKDRGDKIAVVVTATRAGYTSEVRRSRSLKVPD